MNQNLKAALYYHKLGLSIIPAQKNKKPLVKWEQYQKQRPTEALIHEWWGKKYPTANIAIITGQISNLTVIDIDSAKGRELIEELTPESFLTPIVDTPSGGEHRYCRYEENSINAVRFLDGCDIRSEGGYVIAPPSVNGRGGWTWRQGCKITDVSIAAIPELILEKIKHFSSIYKTSTRARVPYNTSFFYAYGEHENLGRETTVNHIDFTKGNRDNALFHVANCLVKGGMPEEEIEGLLTLISQNLCDPPFPLKEVSAKIQSAIKRAKTVRLSISDEVREWALTTSGNFLTTDCHRELQLTTKENRKAANMALIRLEKEGLIVKHGQKRGCYRCAEKTCDEYDPNEIELTEPLKIYLPFTLEHFVELMPGDLVVIAGTPNSGKTALLMNMIYDNMDKWKCFYYSTEMSRFACRRRMIKKDPPPVDNKWKFRFVENFTNFEDVVRPDDLSILDYLEQNEGEAYKIPGILAKIQRKLDKGVAIVALQKNKGMDWGVGGQQTRAKPALFLTVEENYPAGQILKVIKAKTFTDVNPNGFVCQFRIVKGINLQQTTGWGPEYDA